MKHFVWRSIAVSSVLIVALSVNAETRPQYGGTLRLSAGASLTSLDPAETSLSESLAHRNVFSLIFDTLVTFDSAGQPRPALAESWQLSRGNQSCQLRLRQGVKLHDGTPLTVEIAAASLRFANSSWNVLSTGDGLVLEIANPNHDILRELSLSRNAIVKRGAADSVPIGTGLFRIASWEAGKKLTLSANDDYWGGRPYVDRIEVSFGQSLRDQNTDLQLGRIDLVELAPEQAQRSPQDGRQIKSSAPVELLALLFVRDFSSSDEKNLREALALSVERNSIRDVLLKRAGIPAGGILPTWMSGYGFVFSYASDLPRARQLRGTVKSAPAWKLGYDAGDPLNRLLADRVALNAHDAGLSLQPVSSGDSDLRLVRIPLESSDPWVALDDFLNRCGMNPAVNKGNSVQDLYTAEQNALNSDRVIPLFHLPVSYESSAALRGWSIHADGSLDLSNAWMEMAKR